VKFWKKLQCGGGGVGGVKARGRSWRGRIKRDGAGGGKSERAEG